MQIYTFVLFMTIKVLIPSYFGIITRESTDIQPGVPSVRPHYRRMDRRRLPPSLSGCDRVAVIRKVEEVVFCSNYLVV